MGQAVAPGGGVGGVGNLLLTPVFLQILRRALIQTVGTEIDECGPAAQQDGQKQDGSQKSGGFGGDGTTHDRFPSFILYPCPQTTLM